MHPINLNILFSSFVFTSKNINVALISYFSSCIIFSWVCYLLIAWSFHPFYTCCLRLIYFKIASFTGCLLHGKLWKFFEPLNYLAHFPLNIYCLMRLMYTLSKVTCFTQQLTRRSPFFGWMFYRNKRFVVAWQEIDNENILFFYMLFHSYFG